MKPFIIYVDEDHVYGEVVSITKKEFEAIIQEAYEQGRRDGYNSYPIYWPTTTTYPITNAPKITWSTTSTSTDTNVGG